MNPENPQERIIVALDVGAREEALRLVDQLRGWVGLFKVGSQLFTAEGPQLVREIIELGEQVFLDLKFHDIPNTVSKAALVARNLGVSMITVHTSGGSKMMSSVSRSLKASAPSGQGPLVLGVTVLTSLDDQELREVGWERPVQEQVIGLARLAQQSGLDGVVASPVEVPLLRQHFGASLKIVTPGIRLSGSDSNDQNRTTTPLAALKAGADYLVVGRPITASNDPLKSLKEILENMSGTGDT